ncbi:MAG: HAMP domain-containing sensor histidine kinase, partial [Deltaproteobacteria bacterium]
SYGTLPDNINKRMGELEKKANAAAGLLENYCRLTAVTGKGTLCFDEELDCRRDVINPVVQELTMELANREISLTIKSFPGEQYLVDGNKLLLQSVFRTLFHNAIRHSYRKSTITCGLEAHEEQILIFIANEGAVVPKHLQHRIFKQFSKAESDRSVFTAGDGLGLGLFLGRNIINRHGGEIWYEPMPAGSKFVLNLPAASK